VNVILMADTRVGLSDAKLSNISFIKLTNPS
jgi:hypothetical protein